MLTKKSILAIFTICFTLGLSQAKAQGASGADHKELAVAALQDASENANKESDNLKQLYSLLAVDVDAQIEAEAKAAGMSKEKYIETEASFDKFVAQVKATNFDAMEKSQLLTSFLKTGIRLRLQQSIRFPGKNYFNDSDAVQAVLSAQGKKLTPGQ